jgi:MoaA/NifB/PqqE/SkfB family radical SAM enzyme
MKTNLYLPTLLAVIIQVMVHGQTPDNQITQVRKTLISTESSIVNVTYTMKSTALELSNLLKQAKELNTTMQSFKSAAKTKKGDEKKELTIEALFFEKQFVLKQIEISELLAKDTYQKLYQNRNYIGLLLKTIKDDEYTSNLATNLNAEAEKYIRMAKEMREEAYAQATFVAKLGNMTNAEDEEVLALNKQQQVFDIIERVNPKVTVR